MWLTTHFVKLGHIQGLFPLQETITSALQVQMPHIFRDHTQSIDNRYSIDDPPFVLIAVSPGGRVNSLTYFTWPAVAKVDDVAIDFDNCCIRDEAGPVRSMSWVSIIGRVAWIEFWVAGCCQWWRLTIPMLHQLSLISTSNCIIIMSTLFVWRKISKLYVKSHNLYCIVLYSNIYIAILTA